MGSIHGRIVRIVTLAVGLALMVTAGIIAWTNWPRPVHVGTVPQTFAPATGKDSQTVAQVALEPQYLKIPALHVNAPIEPVGIDPAGSLGVPDSPAVVGWWAGGPRPGSAVGTAVIDGHVDTAAYGPGALFNLRSLQPGDEIVVEGTAKSVHFRVAALREYDKASLPTSDIFSQSVSGRLVIVTCGGAFDHITRHYRDNIVAYAVPD
jgi:hypothetical protein